MLNNQLLRYALDIPSNISKEPVKLEEIRIRDLMSESKASSIYGDVEHSNRLDTRVIDLKEEDIYDSWALYRGQGCLESWRKCMIVNPGPVLSQIKYLNDPCNFSDI